MKDNAVYSVDFFVFKIFYRYSWVEYIARVAE